MALVVAVVCLLPAPIMVAAAQSVLITEAGTDSQGRARIRYTSDPQGRFVLLQGDTVTRISQPVATNTGRTTLVDEFTLSLAGMPSTTFFQIERLEVGPPAPAVFTSSPIHGESGVAVTRETILRFSLPLAEQVVLGTDQFHAEFGGRRLLSRVHLSDDRRTATLFYLEPLPASARIRVHVNGDEILDTLGRPLDADGDGEFGGWARIDFDTLSITPVANTAIRGRVFASELVPDPLGTPNVLNTPLAGVTITVDGAEETLRTVTDAMGNFVLSPCPAGRFFVHIDGRTSPLSQWPGGAYYPFVGKEWEAAAGRMDNLAGGTGEVYLPLIVADTLQPVSATEDTTITFPASVLESNPALAGVSITVPANALFSDDGTRGGMVGIAPVSPDRLPGPLPVGLEFSLVITVQSDGGLNFDRPVPVRFPNLPDPRTGIKKAAGEKSALWSFNHDTGIWEIVGPMTVTSDGEFVKTDPGVGILQPGWHGERPGTGGEGDGGDGCNAACCESDLGHFLSCQVPIWLECIFNTLECAISKKGNDCARWGRCVNELLEDCTKCQDSPTSLHGKVLNTSSPFPSEHLLDFFKDTQPVLQGILPLVSRHDLSAEETIELNNLFSHLDSYLGPDQSFAIEILKEINKNFPTYRNLTKPNNELFFHLTGNNIDIRGRTDSNGRYRVIFGSSSFGIKISLFDPVAWQHGSTFLHATEIGDVVLFPQYATVDFDNPSDIDDDGLPDIAEHIIGTDPTNPDTDGDGVSDGAEVRNGTDPLDGLAVSTGIIASAATGGTAVDISAINDIAIVADSEAGISVFNVTAGLNPVRVAQVDTPGTALAVAFSGSLVAVADGSAGLAMVDISDPPAARIVRQLGVDRLGGGVAQAVVSTANLAFVGTSSGAVSMVELDTGVLLQQLNVGSRIVDLAIEGTTLYAYADRRLHVLPFGRGPMVLAGSVDSPTPLVFNSYGLGRLFVGGGTAYAVHWQGYNTFDVTDPADPRLIAAGQTSQLGWKQMVLNGSGLGVAAVGLATPFGSADNIYLHDTRDPEVTDAFITEFETPGIARAVALYNGLAYVADEGRGLQVVNYLSADTGGQAPSGTLRVTAGESTSADTATAGGFVILSAEVADDVQVRNVEFFLDAQRLAMDGSYPFEVVYRVPANAAGRTLTFTARISDTGGNATNILSAPVTVVPDLEPPEIVIESPLGVQRWVWGDAVRIRVMAVDSSGIERVEFTLNGQPVSVRRVSFFEYELDHPPLGTGSLVAVATDRAGNISRSEAVTFHVGKEAVSREFSLYNLGNEDPKREAISREFTLFNFGDEATKREAISREFTLENRP